MTERNTKLTRVIGFQEFEDRCKNIANLITDNSNIKDIFGIPRGGVIPATRIAYLTGLPLTGAPNGKHTAIIDDVLDTGSTRHSFGNFAYFFPLVDKQYEGIKEWIVQWWEEGTDE